MATFFPDSSSRCASPASLLYKMVRRRRLAVQYVWTYRPFPDATDLRGSLYGSGFAFQFAARAQALLLMLVFMSLPTASLENKVMSLPSSVRQKEMMRGSVANPSYEASESPAPREHNTD